MALKRIKLGNLLELSDEKNTNLEFVSFNDIEGVNNNKTFQPYKGSYSTMDLRSYKICRKGMFSCNKATSRNGGKISIAYRYGPDCLVSPSYYCFKVKDENVLLPAYLDMFFSRSEFDRYAITNSWGSATEFFTWEQFCDIDFDLPDIKTQQKFVDVYNSLLKDYRLFNKGLSDLQTICVSFIENLRKKMPCVKIGEYLEEQNEKNIDNSIDLFQGINVDHVFIDPKRIAEDSENGSVVRTGQFAFNKVMKSHNTKLPIALRDGPDCVVSNSYQVFKINRPEILNAKYLMLWFNRSETQRYAGFVSFGTTRDIFTFDDLKEISIPIPDIKIQQSIVNIFESYQKRLEICKKLEHLIYKIKPILIKGAIEEAKRSN